MRAEIETQMVSHANDLKKFALAFSDHINKDKS